MTEKTPDRATIVREIGDLQRQIKALEARLTQTYLALDALDDAERGIPISVSSS